jgi:hypothetical protein
MARRGHDLVTRRRRGSADDDVGCGGQRSAAESADEQGGE